MSTLLTLQESEFKRINPNIITNITTNLIIAENITEQDFPNLIFVTNNPSFSNEQLSLFDIKVYLENNIQPTIIYGLLPIVEQRLYYEQSIAYSLNKNTYTPFINGLKGGTIGVTIDKLSNLSLYTPDTNFKTKKFSLFIKSNII